MTPTTISGDSPATPASPTLAVGSASPSSSPTPAPPLIPPANPSSPSPEHILQDYIELKCKENLTRVDFPEDPIMLGLNQLPLFQAIQAVHRFNESVGPRVVNRQAFLISIMRSTNRWWSPIDGSRIYMDGPNTALIVKLCMTGKSLNPDVFTPSVCHVLQLLTPDQIVQISQDFGKHPLALVFSHDSYYAKQQLFLSLAQTCLKASANSSQYTDSACLRASELSANEAAELGRRREDLSAQAQLHGILYEFIARTCATSKGVMRESDIDNTARDALKRIPLLQAMQVVQHFANSVLLAKHRIQNRSAYLMGIIGGQEHHWEHSRAAKRVDDERGAQALLNLHPRLVLKIAHLCLDGNCFPSDFAPEVCLELTRCADLDTAVRAVMSFNSNKRIAAASKGGVRDRIGFFHGLVRNINLQAMGNRAPLPSPPVTPLKQAPMRPANAAVAATSTPELNPRAKPFSPLQHPFNVLASQVPSTAAAAASAAPMSSSSPQQVTTSIAVAAVETSPSDAASIPTTTTTAAATATIASTSKQMDDAKLLESSRDAIDFLTSSFARSRTSEIRLRRELADAQTQIQMLMAQMQRLREENLRNIENARAQILVNVSRNFDSLLRVASEQQQQSRLPESNKQ